MKDNKRKKQISGHWKRVSMLLGVLITALPLLVISRGISAAALYDISGAGSSITGASGSGTTMGFSFSLMTAIEIGGLGFWDEDHDGLLQDQEIGLWTSAGALVASTTVTNSSTVVASASSEGRWLFSSILPTNLSAGDYVLGAHTSSPDTSDWYRYQETIVNADAAFSFGGSQLLTGGSGLTMPNPANPLNNPGFFGPNLYVGSLSSVPVPAAFWLFSSGLLGLIGVAKRKKA